MLCDKTPSEESLCERINKRDRERRIAIEKRQEEKEQFVVLTEKASYFKESFHNDCNKIRDLLDRARNSSAESLPEIFNKANNDLINLKNYLFESKMFLKVYDVRMAQTALQNLENDVNQLQARLAPRKKFSFNNRNVIKETSEVLTNVKSKKTSVGTSKHCLENKISQKISLDYGENTTILVGKQGEKFSLDPEEVNKNDVLLSDLTQCTVKIHGTPNTLHMINLTQCTILIGPVTTSVFVDDCNDCEFALACQQLRVHNTVNCKIYLHVTSRAIIEDCTKIFVAPYNWTYENQMDHFNFAGLDFETNNWNSVDDFNWLKETQSPNWSILEPELRVKSWD